MRRLRITKSLTIVGVFALATWTSAVADDVGNRAPPIAPAGDAKTGSPDHAQQPGSKSDQNAKQEPTARSPAAAESNPNGGVFVNGSLNVPGAPQEMDTVPAKYSEQNDADDKLLTVQYTFKHLSDDQRRAAYDHIAKAAPASSTSAEYSAGSVIPAEVTLNTLPADVPHIQSPDSFRYLKSGERIVLVAPANRIVVGVLAR